MKAVRPDDQGFTTVEHIRDGLAAYGKLDKDIIHDTEWVSAPPGASSIILQIYLTTYQEKHFAVSSQWCCCRFGSAFYK